MNIPAVGILLAVQVSLVMTQIQCPIRYGQRGCTAFGQTIPAAGSANLRNPCVHVQCSANRHRVTITGCQDVAGLNQHPPGAPGGPWGDWPHCCARCPALPRG
uniref:8.9 kDa family member n=1 Tax=Rhipicephalus zambeziensis TaxID=60191 RepID=A0A224Y194_9ACAR